MANLGKKTLVHPIRSKKDIAAIKKILADEPRNLALFTLGVNSALRASDLLAIRVGDVAGLAPGDYFHVIERKTKKRRAVVLNAASHAAIAGYLAVRRPTTPEAPLFLSREGAAKALTVSHLSELVKGWCAALHLAGRYGSHSLRKTFGYHHRVYHKTDLPTLMRAFNHSTQQQTLAYLGLEPEGVQAAYMREI